MVDHLCKSGFISRKITMVHHCWDISFRLYKPPKIMARAKQRQPMTT